MTVSDSLNHVVVVTGLSGAGKSSALKDLEDMGYEAVDNLPLSLLDALFPHGGERQRPLAVGLDCRTRDFDTGAVLRFLDSLNEREGLEAKLVFMECDGDVLRRRFTETRRRHPLAADRPLTDGIKVERQLTAPLRERADVVFDTTRLPVADLKRLMEEEFGFEGAPGLMVFVTSFAFRNGLPREADLVFDVRFLDNPHYDPKIRHLSGKDKPIADFVTRDKDFKAFFDSLTGLLDITLPRYQDEGKSYLTIGVGCTGGRHRSVFTAERLGTWLRDKGERVDVRHRDLEEGA